jgi:putative PIN family toxin of toxin-antitoxin system
MEKPYQIVIDTNVILAGLKSKKGASYKLLTILNDQRFQINISTTLVFEYEEILKREQQKIGLNNEDIDNIINGICYLANHHQLFYIWRPLAKDKDDDFLIDLALKCQAQFIVSYNQKDLQPVEKFGISILTPKQFLQLLGEIKP